MVLCKLPTYILFGEFERGDECVADLDRNGERKRRVVLISLFVKVKGVIFAYGKS
tara:strand:+ start:55 stop:219 length:165 start_codon:yes stop_codon:yes gene_type:complete